MNGKIDGALAAMIFPRLTLYPVDESPVKESLLLAEFHFLICLGLCFGEGMNVEIKVETKLERLEFLKKKKHVRFAEANSTVP